jgi:hypothetical protein
MPQRPGGQIRRRRTNRTKNNKHGFLSKKKQARGSPLIAATQRTNCDKQRRPRPTPDHTTESPNSRRRSKIRGSRSRAWVVVDSVPCPWIAAQRSGGTGWGSRGTARRPWRLLRARGGWDRIGSRSRERGEATRGSVACHRAAAGGKTLVFQRSRCGHRSSRDRPIRLVGSMGPVAFG